MKKGFTLVELLTVIVILSLLTIITVNVVMNMVKKGKETINTRQEVLYEKAAQVWFSDNSELLPESGLCTYVTLGTLKAEGVLDDELYNIKDMELLDDNVAIKVTNNVSSSGKLNYTYEFNPESITGCTDVLENPSYAGSYIAAGAGQTYKGIVYFDPTNFTRTCSSVDVENNTSINSGCMRFYIYDSTVNEYKMILDHNTSGNVSWASSNTKLQEDTAGWYGNPRLITSTEIASIAGANTKLQWSKNRALGTNTENQSSWFYLDGSGTTYDGWQTQIANSSTESKYAWLYNNTNGCMDYGCAKDANGTNGYWTSDSSSSNNSAWVIDNQGKLNYENKNTDNGFGIRPVITVPKSVVSQATKVVLIPTTASACKRNMTYNGREQTLINEADNVIFTNTTGKNAGDYTVTAIIDPETNLIWEDTTTEAKTFTCTIKTKPLVPSAVCQTKVYDGTTSATCAIELATLVEGETVGITKTCVFNNTSASNGKDITCSGITITGPAALNYRLTTDTVIATANITQQPVTAVANLQVATNGVVTWNNSSNATGYLISIDGTNFTTATSGINYLSTILSTTGTRTVYVKAVNNDTVNFASQTTPTQKSVNVYTVTVKSNNDSQGSVSVSSTPVKVIGGATYSTSTNKLTITGNNTTLYTATATPITSTGYTTTLSNWSPASGTINANTTITANFQRNANSYVLTVNPNGGKYDGSTGNKTYTQDYGTTKSIGNPSENATYTISYNANSQSASYTGSPTSVARPFSSWSLDGTGTFSNGTYTYGAGNGTLTANYSATSSSFTLPAITKTGYTCKWAEGSTSGTQYTGGTSRTISSDKTYYAKCAINTYKLTVNPNGGTYNNTTSNSEFTQEYNSTKNLGTPSATPTYTISYNANSQSASYTGSPTSVARPFSSWSVTSGSGSISGNVFTYGAGNGTVTANYSTTSNSFTLPAITKSGYTCKWAEGSTSGTQYAGGASRTISGNKTYYATCAINQYRLTVNPNGGTFNSTTSSSTFDQNYGTTKSIANPTGGPSYTISYNANSQGASYTGSPTSATRAFSSWTLTGSGSFSNGTYTFGAGAGTLTANWGNATFTLPAISKTGYTCKWAEGSTSGSQYAGGTSRTISGNTTYYAVCSANTYTVKYNGNNNTGGSTASSSHTYDTAKALTTNGFTRTGYTFTGWSTSASDTSKVYDTGEYTGSQPSSASTYNDFKQYSIPAPFAAGEVYQLDVDVKGSGLLYNYFYGAANYLKVASWTNSNGQSGSGTDGFNQIPLTSSYTHYTVRFTLSNSGNTGVVKYLLFRAMPGCTATIKNISFKKVSSSSTAYVNGQSVKNLTSTNGATVNLYAIWNANTYTISLNANGGSGGTTSVNIAYNTAQGNYPSITKPTRTGYAFNGFWDTNAASGGTQWYNANGNSLRTFNLTSNATWYARWTPNTYTIAYNKGTADSGTLPSNQSATYDVNITLGTNSMVKNNTNLGLVTFDANGGSVSPASAYAYTKYTANGWATTSGGGRSYTNGQSVKNLAASGTYNLYPSFTATATSPTFPTPTRSGYTFNGWYSATSGGTKYTSYTGSSAITLHAQWSANTYYVTYDLNGGSNGPSPNPQSFVFNSGAKLSTTVPTKPGYDFAHWKYSNGSNTFAAGAAIPTGWGSFTAVAQWTIHTNTLTVNPNGGSVTFNGAARTSATSVTQNYGTTIAVPNPTRGNANKTISSYTVAYNTDGGSTAPSTQTATKTGTYSYAFSSWSNSGTCGSMSGTTYTFPENKGTTCTKTASWTESLASTSGGSVTLASAPTKSGYSFAGWKSSTNNTVYAAGATYTPTANTTMTAQWTPLALTMNAPTPTGTALTGTGSTKTAGFRVGATVTFTCTGQSGNYPNTLTISGQSAVTNPNNAASISATYTITAPSTSFTISATCTGKVGGSVTVSSVAKPIYRVFQLLYKQNGAASIGSTSSSKQILAANSTSGDGGSQYTLPSVTCTSRGRGCGVQGWDLDNVAYARFATGAKITVCTTGTSGCSGTSSSTSRASSGVIQLGADYDARNVYAITYFKLNNPNKSSGSTTSSLSTSDSSWIYIWNTATSATFKNKCYNTYKPKVYGYTASGSYTLFCSSATCTASNTSPWNSSSFSGYECR